MYNHLPNEQAVTTIGIPEVEHAPRVGQQET